MGNINLGRVIAGGLVAGVIVNIFEGLTNAVLFKDDWHVAMAALGKSDATTKQIVFFNVYGFAMGIMLVLLYASIRSRFGASAKTAMIAGAMMWMLNMAMPHAFNSVLHLYGLNLALSIAAIELAMCLIAGVAGAAIYKEEAAPQAMRASA
jgi:hypothetical protein